MIRFVHTVREYVIPLPRGKSLGVVCVPTLDTLKPVTLYRGGDPVSTFMCTKFVAQQRQLTVMAGSHPVPRARRA
jgi:hypothetical protein